MKSSSWALTACVCALLLAMFANPEGKVLLAILFVPMFCTNLICRAIEEGHRDRRPASEEGAGI